MSALGERELEYIRALYQADEEPLTEVNLGFPQVLLDIDAPLDELMKIWYSVTPSEPPVKKEASPEAANGTWTSSGSHWMFLVNGTPYTGWLIDTDGKHYYFDKDGIMQTGWINDNGKRYYLDLDGIMQTGTVSIDGKDYELQADGSLKK